MSPVFFAPSFTGPFCQRERCLEEKMACGRKLEKEMGPDDILRADYPLLYTRERGKQMKVKLIDFGVSDAQRPVRIHGNDAGARCVHAL